MDGNPIMYVTSAWNISFLLYLLLQDSLDELEKMVVPKFENVVNKNAVVPRYEEHAYGPDEVGV